jgi:hypothetical protein
MDFENQKETYLAVMIATLTKKSEILAELIELSKQQEALIKEDKIDEDLFNRNIEEKDQRIRKLLELDEGFETVYLYLKEELAVNKDKYREEIQKLKDLITTVTNQGVRLQVIEKQNKSRMDVYFRTKRSEIRNLQRSSQTATSYYKNITNQDHQQSYFFDKKN